MEPLIQDEDHRSEEEKQADLAAAELQKKKKKRKLRNRIILVLVLILIVGGIYGYYRWQQYQAALAATADAAKLPFLEKTVDDYLFGIMNAHRYDAASLEMLIAFLLQKQREATDVRLVMAGKLNGFSPEEVGERMRELNG